VLSVWLESAEPLAKIRVVVQEARNLDCPLGFTRGQNGVDNELPPMLKAEGIRAAWQTETLHPAADWTEVILLTLNGQRAIEVQQLSAATAPTGTDLRRPRKAFELRQRPLLTSMPLVHTEQIVSTPQRRVHRHQRGSTLLP
jgi:hypothetical protein